jgi:hypothetical protein
MKLFKASTLVLVSALLLASTALAANKGSLNLSEPVNISGTKLAAGSYSVHWEGNGPNVELKIMRGKQLVASSPARLVDLSSTANNDTAVFKSNGDGSKSLSEIRFYGKKQALAIGSESADSGSSTK